MDFNATIDLIIRELDEAREIIDDLKRYPGAPLMQIELAKSKCRNASEVISLLKDVPHKYPEHSRELTEHEAIKKTPEKTSHPDAPKLHAGKEQVLPESQINEQEPQKSSPVEIISPEKPLPRDIPDGPAPGKENRIPDEQKSISGDEQKAIPGKAEKKPYVAPIIADTFSHLANRYEQAEGDEFSYVHGKHYSSLSDAIGVNDKFFYIREIFNGDRDAYHQALSRLEKTETLTEAKVVLMSYKEDKKENAAMKQLLELVKRKFSRDE